MFYKPVKNIRIEFSTKLRTSGKYKQKSFKIPAQFKGFQKLHIKARSVYPSYLPLYNNVNFTKGRFGLGFVHIENLQYYEIHDLN